MPRFLSAIGLLLICSVSAFAATAHLTWTPSGTASNARVERNLGGGAFSVMAPALAGTTSAYDDATLPLNQVACYRVVEYSGFGDGPASNQACVTTVVPTGASALTVTVTQP